MFGFIWKAIGVLVLVGSIWLVGFVMGGAAGSGMAEEACQQQVTP